MHYCTVKALSHLSTVMVIFLGGSDFLNFCDMSDSFLIVLHCVTGHSRSCYIWFFVFQYKKNVKKAVKICFSIVYPRKKCPFH